MNNNSESDMKNKFCCKSMVFTIENYDIIEFEDYFRAYNLLTSSTGIGLKLKFCPFCGKSLGRRLNLEYFSVLNSEYGIDMPDTFSFTNVPEEFKSDKWWRKRGL